MSTGGIKMPTSWCDARIDQLKYDNERLRETDRLREIAFVAYAEQEKQDRAEIERLKKMCADLGQSVMGLGQQLRDKEAKVARLQTEREELRDRVDKRFADCICEASDGAYRIIEMWNVVRECFDHEEPRP
jgi:hypothetical protein